MSDLRSKFNSIQSGVIHSSGFANVTDGGTANFGTTSTESFTQRLRVERNRQHVRSFGSAGVLHGYRLEANTALPVNRQGTNIIHGANTEPLRSGNRVLVGRVDTGITRQGPGARSGARLTVPTRFKEPSPRHYSPYR
jgi:hypothetical protein